MIINRLESRSKMGDVGLLEGMGFPSHLAREALREGGGTLEGALDYIERIQESRASRHLPFERRGSSDMISFWQERNIHDGCLSEYRTALGMICLSSEVMGTSTYARTVKALEESFRSDSQKGIQGSFEECTEDAVAVAFGLSRERARVYTANQNGIAQGLVFEGAMQVWGAVDASRKKHLHAAMHVMSARALKNQQGEEGRTELKVVLGLLERSSKECMARKRWVVGIAVQMAASGMSLTDHDDIDGSDDGNDSDDHGDVRMIRFLDLRREIHVIVDGLKEKALDEAFLRPTKRYAEYVGDEEMGGDVDVHGANTYLAILLSTLGVITQRLPFMGDQVKGVAQFIEAEGNGAGQPDRVPTFQRVVSRNLFLFNGATPGEIARMACDPSPGNAQNRIRLSAYLERFAASFTCGVIVPRIINAVVSDDRLSSMSWDALLSMGLSDLEREVEDEDSGINSRALRAAMFRHAVWREDLRGNYVLDEGLCRKFLVRLGVVM